MKNVEKTELYVFLFTMFVMFFSISVLSEATYDTGDGIRHYLVSRYSWKHPDLFLYSWGKPFFTTITSPFAQFGLMGITFFNIICAVFSALFCYKIAKMLNIGYALLVIPFLCFTPIYFPTINSGLTEPLFGLLLISSIYLVLKNNDVWACILISFLPFVRTEGMLLLPLFFVVMVYRKKFFISLLLAFGTLLYSIIGYFYYKDFFWIINQNPYDGKNKAIYGHGELLHFVTTYSFTFGLPLAILFVLGCFAIVYKIAIKLKNDSKKEKLSAVLNEENILIVGSFCVYFVAHSIMWWKGLANSLGLIRVLAGVMPCAAIICLRGFNLLMIPFFEKQKAIKIIVTIVILIAICVNPFTQYYFPHKLNPEEATVQETGGWYKTQPFKGKKIFYLYPYLAHVLDIDPFDTKKVGELWGLYPAIKEWGIGAIPDSTLVFWDSHFGPNECSIPLDTMLNDPNFELIKTIKPKVDYKTLGGRNFEVYVFRKTDRPLKKGEITMNFFDLENENGALINNASITEEKAFSGKRSCKLSEKEEYSVTFKKNLSEIPAHTTGINLSMKFLDPSNNTKDNVAVLSIDDEQGKNLFWEGKPIVLGAKENNGWQIFETHFNINKESYPEKSSIKIYVWNKTKKEFYIDDIKIIYLGMK